MRTKVLLVLILASAIAPAQWSFQYSGSPNVTIPPSGTGGALGGCSNAANQQTVSVTGTNSVQVTDVNVTVGIGHTFASDLRITLVHGGVSVVLFDRHGSTVGKQFYGAYTFDDEAPAGIAASVVPGQAVLAAGSYQPQAPLAAFDGVSAAGPWELQVCDLAVGDTGVLYQWTVSVQAGSYIDAPIGAAINLDDGGPSGCAVPLTQVINVPPLSGPVSHLQIGLGISHGRAADLSITVTHGPVTVALTAPNSPSSGAWLGDLYSFDDAEATSWDQILGSISFGVIPFGTYKPHSPLSAFDGLDASGPWFFTICDSVQNTVTGQLYALTLSYQEMAFELDVYQLAGSSSITLRNKGGVPGNLYLNAFTLAPGSFPYGWFHGLDISMAEIVNQMSLGVPFFGLLDASGGANVTIPGPIPAGLNVQFTSVQATPGGAPISSIPARSYTTAP